MAGADGPTSRSVALLRALEREPWAYGFFSALRRLEAVGGEGPGFGRSRSPREDPVRLAQEPSLAFVARTLHALEAPSQAGAPRRLSVYAPGLFGPSGALPLHLTERAVERRRHRRDDAFPRFADIFHHRMLSLLYRAWADGRPEVGLDRGEEDGFARIVESLGGLRGARPGRGLSRRARAGFSGALAGAATRLETLERMSAAILRVPVEVAPFRGSWLEPPTRDRARLGGARLAAAAPPVLGRRVWSRSHAFEMRLGPLSAEDYDRFLPGGSGGPALSECVALAGGLDLSWSARLLRDPSTATGAHAAARAPSGRLGQDAWLGRPAAGRRALDDLTVSGERYETRA